MSATDAAVVTRPDPRGASDSPSLFGHLRAEGARRARCCGVKVATRRNRPARGIVLLLLDL